jgi:hypothetical protein
MTKKHIFSFLVVAVNFTGAAFGQGLSESLPGNEIAHSKTVIGPATPGLRMNEVHAKAMRHFTREYKDVTGAYWYTTVDGFAVYFKYKNVRTKLFYDKKGRYWCTARYYEESVLPAEVRHNVRSRFYDYAIFHVVEVSAGENTAYLMKLEGKKSWMDIKFRDNEIEVLKEYTKL